MRRQELYSPSYPSFFGQGREEARYCVCILRGNRRRPCRRRRRYAVYSSGVIPRKIWRRCSLLFSRKKDGHAV